MAENKEPDNRRIEIKNGNYIESVGRDYIQGNVYYNSLKKEPAFPKVCQNQEHLTKYLKNTTKNLQQKFGFIEFKNDIIEKNNIIKLLARKANFDMSIGFVPMRGEAFFIFSEFEEINFASLKAFSAQCLNYAKTRTNSSTAGSAFYNFKIPNNLCFAVALVDEIDEETRKNVWQINPLKDKVDALCYIPS